MPLRHPCRLARQRHSPSDRLRGMSLPTSVMAMTVRTTAVAPRKNDDRNKAFPLLEISPERDLPPLESACGVTPSQDAKCLADLKTATSGAYALIDTAVIVPVPGDRHETAEVVIILGL